MSLRFIKRVTLLTGLILALSTSTKAQGNLPYVDGKLFHFGFLLGFNSLDFAVTPSNLNINGNVYSVAVSELQPGFSVGIISDLRLQRYLNLRFTPTLHFGSRVLNYTTNGTTFSSTAISSIPINLPILLKYSAERKKNYRPYLVFGGGMGIDMNTDQTKDVLLKPLNFYTEFGAGCDLYFSFFKMSPELKFAIGLNDVLMPLADRNAGDVQNKQFTNALSKLTSRMITLSFNFE